MADSQNTEELPLAAPCRQLHYRAPLGWLRQGWQDMKAAPRQSLGYGFAMVVLSYLVSAAAFLFGSLGLYLALVTGFVFAGPWLALTLYAISMRLERGQPVTLRLSILDAGQAIGNAMVFTVILTVVFLLWARAATVIHVFFPETGQPELMDMLLFLTIGTLVGSLFCAIIFTASAFSLPMIMERRVDTVTAVISSINAVLRNPGAMAVWAAIIVSVVFLGFITAWLAFWILLPVLGHATWHAYRDTIDANAWPLLGTEPD